MFDTSHRRLMTLAVIAMTVAALLATALPASAAGRLDQSQTSDSAGTEGLGELFYRLGQTFTAGITGDLVQVDLLLYRAGSPGNLTVQIRTVSGGVPSNTILSTATVAAASVPEGNPNWVSVPFSNPAISTAGMQYAIVLSASGVSSASPFYGWGVALGNPYAGGDAFTSVDSGASWIPLIGLDNTPLDRAFKTYVAVVDTTPPTITTPVNMVAAATTQAGANVAYTVTATDDVDGPVPVTCLPPPGSTFPIGTTTVTCTASDAAGNDAGASFGVHVQGAAEQLQDLLGVVNSLPRSKGLARKLQAAADALADGKTRKACTLLNAFIEAVREDDDDEDDDRRLSPEQAAELIAVARRIRAVLGC